MKRCLHLFVFTLLVPIAVIVAEDESYPTHPDMVKKEGVPEGVIQKGVFDSSSIYPGTSRDYAVYVPAQYDETQPAALMVFQDGMSYLKTVPVAFDNLIHQGDMPVTVALFVNPGVVPELSQNVLPRFNRSFEYDAADDRYSRFLLEEMMPLALLVTGWFIAAGAAGSRSSSTPARCGSGSPASPATPSSAATDRWGKGSTRP